MTEPNGQTLEVELAPRHPKGLRLANPVMTASGTFGYGIELADLLDIQRLGAIVCKGTTLLPREGNPQPRVAETPSGMLNSIGLQNVGVRCVVTDKAPVWARWKVPVIVNISGETVEEYRDIAAALEGVPGVSGIEVNISCPNVAEARIEFGRSVRLAAKVTEAVRSATTLPVIVKMTPNVTDVTEIARAVADSGADAISAINTLIGMAIDVRLKRPLLGAGTGGLSGPAIRPVAVAMVYQIRQAVDIPIVGIGGVETASDALEFIMAGATAVQIGTANFRNPKACLDVIAGIQDFMRREGIRDINDLVGAAVSQPEHGRRGVWPSVDKGR